MARERQKSAAKNGGAVQAKRNAARRRKAALKGHQTRRSNATKAPDKGATKEAEDEALRAWAEAAELKARGVPYRAIGEQLKIPHSTAHAWVHRWYRHLARAEDVESIRNALGAKYEWIYSQFVGLFAQIARAPDPKNVPPELQAALKELGATINLAEKVRLSTMVLDKLSKVVELHGKVAGVYTEGAQVNIGPGAGSSFQMQVQVPTDPKKLEQYVDHLRRADELAGIQDADELPLEGGGS